MTARVVIALVLYAMPDGGVKFDAPLYASCPDAPALVVGDGGVWLPDPRPARLSCIMATCEVDRQLKTEELKTSSPSPSWVQVVTSVTVAVAAAISAVSALTK